MKTIGIIGSRRRCAEKDFCLVRDKLLAIYKDGDEIVSGGCWKGGDAFAERLAKTLEIPIKIYYAKWKKLGKCAGYARNGLIARDSDVLIACVAPDRKGGTEDTIKKFGTKGAVYLI